MKKCFLTLLVLAIVLPETFSQDTIYLSKGCSKVSILQAHYMRITTKKSKSVLKVRDYTMNGTLFMEAECILSYPIYMDGKCSYYYENGKKKIEGQYTRNEPSGEWTYWSEDGSESTTAFFDEKGKMTGMKGIPSTIVYSNIECNYSQSEVFTTVEVDAEFPGGNEALLNYIIANVVYPKEAEIRVIHGKVMVYFEIDASGNVCNVKSFNNPYFGLAEEAVRVVSSLPKWKPAMQDGKTVRVRRMIPISFMTR